MGKRTRKQTIKNNLIILCEGTDTEFNYFTEAKIYLEKHYPDRFSKIKIVPVRSELISNKNPKRAIRKQLIPIPQGAFHYYCLCEQSEADYNRYKQQPTRYVRETQLYLETEGFTEGWVVFDRDVHPDHENAFKLANSVQNLNIAFSSYCFEVWLLAHFERNNMQYTCSECMRSKHDPVECGFGTGDANDCKGVSCLAGKLREKKYIHDYTKSKKNIFTFYTLKNIEKAFINAAWLRNLNKVDAICECNPYTDVDKLIARLLDKKEIYRWEEKDSIFDYSGTRLSISVDGQNLIFHNVGNRNCIIDSGYFFFCKEYGVSKYGITLQNKLLTSGANSGPISIPNSYSHLLIKEGNSHIFVEL